MNCREAHDEAQDHDKAVRGEDVVVVAEYRICCPSNAVVGDKGEWDGAERTYVKHEEVH